MNYIVTKLVTEGDSQEFSILGLTQDEGRAAEIAAAAYKEYTTNASQEQDERMRKMSQALFEGTNAARRGADGQVVSCPIEQSGE